MRSNVGRVFEKDEVAGRDVFTVDVDAALRRFANLNPGVTPESLRTYRARIFKALDLFRMHIDDPVNFRVSPSNRTSRSIASAEKRQNRSSNRGKAATPTAESIADSSKVSVPSAPPPDALSYPYPLRPDVTVLVSNIPRDLRVNEAERLAAFLRALCVDFGSEKEF